MLDYLYLLPGILLAISLHEFAHGWVSWKLGDPTPKQEGRLSINPLRHLDPAGAVCMLLFRMGWAKPVMINPWYYKNRKVGVAMVSLAGPLMNLLTGTLSMFAVVWMNIAVYTGTLKATAFVETIYLILYYFSQLSINLAVFNLIPLPPLDGSKIFGIFLPDSITDWLEEHHNYCMIILMVALYLGFLDGPIFGIYQWIYDGIGGIAESVFLHFMIGTI